MRLVLDTNVVASGLLWNGPPAELIELAKAGDIELFTSHPLLAELSNILLRPKFAKAIAATRLPGEELVSGYIELARTVRPAVIFTRDRSRSERRSSPCLRACCYLKFDGSLMQGLAHPRLFRTRTRAGDAGLAHTHTHIA